MPAHTPPPPRCTLLPRTPARTHFLLIAPRAEPLVLEVPLALPRVIPRAAQPSCPPYPPAAEAPDAATKGWAHAASAPWVADGACLCVPSTNQAHVPKRAYLLFWHTSPLQDLKTSQNVPHLPKHPRPQARHLHPNTTGIDKISPFPQNFHYQNTEHHLHESLEALKSLEIQGAKKISQEKLCVTMVPAQFSPFLCPSTPNVPTREFYEGVIAFKSASVSFHMSGLMSRACLWGALVGQMAPYFRCAICFDHSTLLYDTF